MVDDIVINKADELIPMLNKMGRHGSLLMVLFAMERQWQLFLQEMNGNAECENLCNSAKECKKILWEHFFALSKHQSSKNRNRYLEQVENLESIEFGTDVYYSRPFIENLMQTDFLLSETERLSDAKNCAYMILSPLEVILDYCEDTIEGQHSDATFIKIVKEDSRVISELKRVDCDLLLANNISTNMDTIIGLRYSYQEVKLI